MLLVLRAESGSNIAIKSKSTYNTRFPHSNVKNSKTYLYMHVPQDRQGKWVELLPDIEKAINEVEVRTTGVTPVTIQHLIPIITMPLADRLNILPPIIDAELIYNQVNEQRRHDREYHDHRIHEKGRKLIPSDPVYIITYPISSKFNNISAKLCPKARGPFCIVEEMTQNCYIVIDRKIQVLFSLY